MNELFFILVGYLSGSILYAYLLPKYICHIDIMKDSDDHNPGTFNAFALAGTQVGILVIALELLKGFLPIWLASHILDTRRWMFAFVLCAPVAGHAFPLFYPKRGGKAIAVSFGVLLGLLPRYRPVLLLIFFYLLFSFLIVVKPHLYRSILELRWSRRIGSYSILGNFMQRCSRRSIHLPPAASFSGCCYFRDYSRI